ncbi:hypothetical protein F7725_011085 [Dissostichus mawsoni]|uniref:Uncharacterized protein n=1 Tax=Dissostichus mawsoni TaxID=36200 RepID=A0A7J5Z7U6_DISMA|nr:hypothetical protein F7725_011085 [Dissostichus mawsoni]
MKSCDLLLQSFLKLDSVLLTPGPFFFQTGGDLINNMSAASSSVALKLLLINVLFIESSLQFTLQSFVLIGVIAVVIFVIVSVLAITARFLYRRKETYRNQEVKGVKQEDSQDFHFNNQTDPQNMLQSISSSSDD